MYAALWHALPGPTWLRFLLVILLIAVVLAALVFWVFPWADHYVTPQEVTVEQP
jgi:hypothetical protein